jgi:hypothetical protein
MWAVPEKGPNLTSLVPLTCGAVTLTAEAMLPLACTLPVTCTLPATCKSPLKVTKGLVICTCLLATMAKRVVQRHLALLQRGQAVAPIGHHQGDGVIGVAIYQQRQMLGAGFGVAGKAKRLKVLHIAKGLTAQTAQIEFLHVDNA